LRYLQFGDRITEGRLLSSKGVHALALKTGFGELIAVRSGFTSGYSGEGPRALSLVMLLLTNYDIDVVELEVPRGMIQRLNEACLTQADLELIEAPPPAFGGDVYRYIDPRHSLREFGSLLAGAFPPVVPLAIVDARLADLAVNFWDGPDDCLMTAYRRLEDAVRQRTGIREHGAKVFSRAFLGEQAQLVWSDLDPREQAARGQLFADAFSAFRNPRAHREIHESPADQLAEFLTANHLFRLEAQASLAALSQPADEHASKGIEPTAEDGIDE
jgi:hypothetical protein